MNRITSIIVSLLLFMAVNATLMAQTAAIDSLQQVARQQQGEQLQKTLNRLARAYISNGQIAEAASIYDRLIDIDRELGAIEHESNHRHNKLAILYYYHYNDSLRREVPVQQAWFAKHENWEEYYYASKLLADSYYFEGKIQTALREAERIMDDAKKRDHDFGRALALMEMGQIYCDMAQYDQAVDAYSRCVKLLKTLEDQNYNISLSYLRICESLDRKRQYDEEARVSSEWKAFLDNWSRQNPDVQDNLNNCYIDYHSQAFAIRLGKGLLDQAAQELKEIERINGEVDDDNTKYYILVYHAQLARAMGDIKTAEAYSEQYSRDEGGTWDIAKRLRAELLMESGRYREAAMQYRTLYEEKDSSYTRDTRMQLDELNTLYKLDELEMKNQLERSRFIAGIVSIIVIALLVFIYLRHKAAKRLEKKNSELAAKNTELQLANQRAEELSKMKSAFIQNISHEIRTPLNILGGFTQIVTTPGIQMDEEQMNDARQRINENTHRITELVNKMLELSDINSQTVISRPDSVSAAHVATQAVQESGIEHATHVSFNMQLADGAIDTMLHTNLHYAVRVLTLLLDNAQKFTKQGTVTLKVDTADSQVVKFVVEDTGIGISEHEAEHIFDEFVQLDDYYDGTGIGLTVARSIARRLGGETVLDTSYTQGARFIVTLPVA